MKRVKPKTVIIIIISVLLLVICSISIYVYSLLSSIKYTDISKVQDTEPITSSEKDYVYEDNSSEDYIVPDEKPTILEKTVQQSHEIKNIALFGLDRRGSEACRTDTIIITSIDKANSRIKLTSLMRDMYIDIPGKRKNRINAAYAYGGPGLAINTINQDFNMDIKYFASIDFKGVKKLIDSFGGVDINVKKGEIPYINSNSNFKISSPGMQHLNGEQALAYMRIRHYGNGDYERTERQRTVLTTLFGKVRKSGVLKFPSLVSAVLPYVETNMPKSEIIELGLAMLGFQNNIEQYRLPVEGTFKSASINRMAVLVPDVEQNTKYLHDFIYGNDRKVAATN